MFRTCSLDKRDKNGSRSVRRGYCSAARFYKLILKPLALKIICSKTVRCEIRWHIAVKSHALRAVLFWSSRFAICHLLGMYVMLYGSYNIQQKGIGTTWLNLFARFSLRCFSLYSHSYSNVRTYTMKKKIPILWIISQTDSISQRAITRALSHRCEKISRPWTTSWAGIMVYTYFWYVDWWTQLLIFSVLQICARDRYA